MTTATEILVAQVYERLEFPKPTDYRLELVYVDYRDGFTPEQVEDLLRDGYCEHTDEWISERQWESACDLADEMFKEACDDDELYLDLEDEWRDSSERSDLIDSIVEADTSNPYKDLLRNTGTMLFRVQPDEDHMAWLSPEALDADGPGKALAELGLDLDFAPAVAEILPEIAGYACEGGAHFLPAIVFSANPSDLWPYPEDADVTISDPFLWLTNPWSGNGYGVVAKGCSVTVKRSDIHTDRHAWGYGANDVFGGLILDDSTITIKEGA